MGNPAGVRKKLREKRRKKLETRLVAKELGLAPAGKAVAAAAAAPVK